MSNVANQIQTKDRKKLKKKRELCCQHVKRVNGVLITRSTTQAKLYITKFFKN